MIFLNIISQLCLMVATALPLKIILMMSSDRVPKYFPSFMAEFDRNHVIYSLTVASIMFWIIFALLNLLAGRISSVASNKMILQGGDLDDFSKQRKKATDAYRSYVKSISDIVFSIIAVTGIMFLYPAVAVVCIVYFIIIKILLVVLYSLKPSKRLSEIKGDISKIMSAAGNIGFLVVFLYMIYDFANGSMPGLLYALIAVILCRQLLRSYTRALAAILRLYGINNRLILNKFYIGE
jgi:hypothetical protein